MSNNQFNLHYEAELNEGIRVTTLSPIFCSGDIEAHSFVVKVMRKGKPVNLAGTTVRGFFIRPDNVTITLEGSVNADGEAVVTLSNACYNKQGRFQLVIRVTMGGVISTVFCGLGGMLLTVTDGFIDEDNVIPSLGDLLAQIDAMKEATAAALEAAARANEAAENAGSGAGYPVVGTVEANKHITLSGDLEAGTYTLHYEDKNGTPLSQIVTLEVTASEGGDSGGGDEPGDDTGGEETNYTNQISISTDTDGSIYNGKGWIENQRLNSSGLVKSVDAYGYTGVTGFVPIAKGDIIRTSANIIVPDGSTQQCVCYYDSNKTFLHRVTYASSVSNGFGWDLFTINADYSFTYKHNVGYTITGTENAAYVRFCFAGITDGTIITKNEEIA